MYRYVFLSSMTMTMIARPVASLCTHGSDLPWVPECVGCRPFLAGRAPSHRARNNCSGITVQWACICAGNGCCVWRCLVVLVCVSMWQYVVVCVVVVVLLVASVLASMRWLLCGGDETKKNEICNSKKYPAREFYLHYGFYLINSKKNALTYSHYRLKN